MKEQLAHVYDDSCGVSGRFVALKTPKTLTKKQPLNPIAI